MTPDEFKTYLEKNRETFQRWGNYVIDQVIGKLRISLGYEPTPLFIKIPPLPRIKDIDSALGKIGRKKYDDPIRQVTDIVGVRFVVLLSNNIEMIGNIISSEEAWIAVASKDYQDEIDKNPKLFDYQSQHFEVRPAADMDIDGFVITRDMCCEVQIRTLLQHAYAELVHDSLYKPVGPVPAKAERQVAKSMALMETTDDLFCSTMQLLYDTNKPRNDFLSDLTAIYAEKIGQSLIKLDVKTNYAVLDEFRDYVESGISDQINQFLETKKYIPKKIASRASSYPFFAQPVSVFIYWLIDKAGPDKVHKCWPLPGYWRELEIILSDLDGKPTHT